jgi:hypothetical protein
MFVWLINFLTFPGVMLHEWSHQFFCRLFNVPVLKVVYFRFGNPLGYVIHAEAPHMRSAFWIGIGPLIINSLVSFSLAYLLPYLNLEQPLHYFSLWLAFAFAFHALPSTQDASNILDKNHRLLAQGKLHYLLIWPFIALCYLLLLIANKLKYLSLDFIYAIAILYLARAINF